MLQATLISVLLAVHNIGLVVVAGAPFYLDFLLEERARVGGDRGSDMLVEGVFRRAGLWGMAMLLVIGVTGFGMPLVHLWLSGSFRALNQVEMVAFGIKMAAVVALFAAVFAVSRGLNPRIAALASKGGSAAEIEKLRATRVKALLAWRASAGFALIASAFLRFGT